MSRPAPTGFDQRAFVGRKAVAIRDRIPRCGVQKDGWVLCLGCGGPDHQEINRVFEQMGGQLVGLDTQDFNVAAFAHLFQSPAVLGNAMRLPFADRQFAVVVFTDVLEHLHDPLAGLKEIQRVLQRDGKVLLTTNVRHHHGLVFNPVALAQIWGGQFWPAWLPRRDITQEIDGKLFYHTEFSRRELTVLLREAGLRILTMRTENFFSTPEQAAAVKPRLLKRVGLGEEFVVWATPSQSG